MSLYIILQNVKNIKNYKQVAVPYKMALNLKRDGEKEIYADALYLLADDLWFFVI
jgi:hypothetical protein